MDSSGVGGGSTHNQSAPRGNPSLSCGPGAGEGGAIQPDVPAAQRRGAALQLSDMSTLTTC